MLSNKMQKLLIIAQIFIKTSNIWVILKFEKGIFFFENIPLFINIVFLAYFLIIAVLTY